jgi:hypothetical protein
MIEQHPAVSYSPLFGFATKKAWKCLAFDQAQAAIHIAVAQIVELLPECWGV